MQTSIKEILEAENKEILEKLNEMQSMRDEQVVDKVGEGKKEFAGYAIQNRGEMSKSRIEWCDYTINPVKGLCPMACSYCYARRMYKRFKWNQEIRYDSSAFKGLPSKPSKVFVGSTMELFGSWIERDWWHMIMAKCLSRPQHTFIFLTKCPQNLPLSFPDNCWVGVTATNSKMVWNAYTDLIYISASKKYLSLEPLLDEIDTRMITNFRDVINWLIIGAQTPYSIKTAPQKEWIDKIIDCADGAGIPIFLKNNLKHLLGNNLRQEFPREENEKK